MVLLVERINNRKYGVTANDFLLLGVEVERLLETIKEHEYGIFRLEDYDLNSQLALRVIEGMNEWQQKHNKGVKIFGDTHLKVEFYDMEELEKRIDEMYKNISY